jgi:dipeptidyl aminopeptidase/acylaminoacyl peptidase
LPDNQATKFRGESMFRIKQALAILVLLPLTLVAVDAQDRTAPRTKAKPARARQGLHQFQDVSVSPDGQFVVWRGPGTGKGSRGSPALYLTNLRSPEEAPRSLTGQDRTDQLDGTGAVWSPDGSQIAFFSTAGGDQQQVFVVPAAGGAARKLTNVKGALSELRWSPDGKQIGFLIIENPPRQAGPLAAVPPETGVIGEKTFEQRLAVVPTPSGEARLLTPPDVYVYEFAWSPDSTNLALIAAHGSGDNNWYIAQLYTLSSSSGEMNLILKPAMQIAQPCWSPDGKSIAFIGGLMSDEGIIGGDIFTTSAAGRTPKNLTPDIKASPCWLTWLSSGRILFTEMVDGGTGIGVVDPVTGQASRLWSGWETIAAEAQNRISIAQDEKTSVLVRQSFELPPEIWAGPIGDWRQVTHANDGATSGMGRVVSMHWKSDEFTVQGGVIYPTEIQEGRRYPMVVFVHGGPAYQPTPQMPDPRFNLLGELSRAGYFVFMANPRGSYGQGEKFTRANVKDFGYGDLRDIIAGVDEAVKSLPVDKDRLAIMGGSYGGYMTMWAVTQTNRFRAAVAIAGVSNWQSYYGENGIDQWLIPYFGASVYDDPSVYARSSPITFIKRVKTPTLVLAGEWDVECPLPQSYEFWHALKALGVPTEFVVYPKEGHGFNQPEHLRDMRTRLMAWLKKYM